MIRKRIISLILAGAMLLPMNVFAGTVKASDFKDMPSDWSAEHLIKAVDNGLLTGSDGNINASGALTAAELATIVNRAFGAKETASLDEFTDVALTAWYREDMAKAVKMGTFKGANGKLSPESPVTRERAFTVLARAFALDSGSSSALSAFADKDDVSAWAASLTAALVSAGHINGSNGKLNPKSNITRAEFAKLIDSLASSYIDKNGTDSKTVNGNAVVRESGVSLSGLTVNGDLIIADGAENIKLDNVKVTGRIIIRGSADKVKTTGSTSAAKGMITVKDGKTENVAAGTSGANTSSGNSSATGGGSSSGGSSSGSSSSGNSSSGSSTTPAEAAIAEASEMKVVTTDAGSWLPLVFKSGFTKENTTVTVDGVDVTKYVTNVTDDGSTAKLPLIAKPGTVKLTSNGKTQTVTFGTAPESSAVYTGDDYLPDYFLAHGPVAMWDYYLTNYDDEGNVRINAKKTTFGTAAAVNEHPSYSENTVLDEGNESGTAVIMFNYTKDNDKTWFDNIAKYDESAHDGALQLVSHDQYKTVLNYNLQFEKGTADHNGNTVATLSIPFNQSNFRTNGRYYVRVCSTDAATGKKSYTLVPIQIVNHDAPELTVSETPESGRNLHFKLKNMVYAITSPIESVTLRKPDGTVEKLENINDYFHISQDSFVLYNDVKAENGKDHLDQAGNYTITIDAAGFKTFSCTFNVAEGAQSGDSKAAVLSGSGSVKSAAVVDALSSATSGGSSSSGTSSDGGYAVSANLLFKGDLLANALILEKLGAETEAAGIVLDYWKSNTVSDAVFNVGDTSYYSWSSYISAVNTAQTQNKLYIPFAEYRNTVQPDFAAPRATKEVLEDGLLGDIQDSSISGKLETPRYTVSGKQGENAVFTFTGENAAEYLNNVTALYLNGDWRELSEGAYTIKADAGTITIASKYLPVGKTQLIIQSAGYQPLKAQFEYGKVNESGLALDITAEENKPVHVVISGSDGDFLKNLKSVTLTKDGKDDPVYAKGVEGSDAVYYVIADDRKSLDLYNVTPGTYTLSISAEYYDEELTAAFTVTGEDVTNEAPDMEITGNLNDDKLYTLSFEGKKGEDGNYVTEPKQAALWRTAAKSAKSLTVNGVKYTEFAGWLGSPAADSTEFKWTTGAYGDELVIGGSEFTKDAENEIVIEADGYKPLTVKVNKDGTVNTGSTPVGPTEPPKPDQPGETAKLPTVNPTVTNKTDYTSYNDYYELKFSDDDSAWISKITGININGSDWTVVDSTGNIKYNNYFIDKENGTVDLYKLTVWNSSIDMVVSAEGYDDLVIEVAANGFNDPTFKIKNTGVTEPIDPSKPGETTGNVPAEAPSIEKLENTSGNDYYALKFRDTDSEWISKINSVAVGSYEYKSVDSVDAISTWNYFTDKETNTLNLQITSSLYGDTYTVTIGSEGGYSPLKLEVTLPGIFGGNTSITIVK